MNAEPHGYSYYTNHGCRCAACRRAMALYNKKRRAERWAITASEGLPNQVPHGNPNSYWNWGCHCSACREAVNEKERLRRERRKEGSRRESNKR